MQYPKLRIFVIKSSSIFLSTVSSTWGLCNSGNKEVISKTSEHILEEAKSTKNIGPVHLYPPQVSYVTVVLWNGSLLDGCSSS